MQKYKSYQMKKKLREGSSGKCLTLVADTIAEIWTQHQPPVMVGSVNARILSLLQMECC